MRAITKRINDNAELRITAGAHLVVPDFSGQLSFAIEQAGPWALLATFKPMEAIEIRTADGFLAIESEEDGEGQISIGRID